jgi:hypothetical protein
LFEWFGGMIRNFPTPEKSFDYERGYDCERMLRPEIFCVWGRFGFRKFALELCFLVWGGV